MKVWERKHEPRAMADLALDLENRRAFDGYVAQRQIPRDLIFVGPPGHGKSTAASILENTLAFDRSKINASGRLGIDFVRGELLDRVRVGRGWTDSSDAAPPYRIIRLEEAQFITADALAALRTVLDDRPLWVRFIFCSNKLPPDVAVVDRCRVHHFDNIPLDEMVNVIERILAAEGKVGESEVIRACARVAPSMRWLIDHVERCFDELGHLELPRRAGKQPREHTARTVSHQDLSLLEAVLAILQESGRPRLRTKDIILELAELDDPQFSDLDDLTLARVLRPLGVKPRCFTPPGAKSARGYVLREVETALARHQKVRLSPSIQ